jgi:hypothetical protein
MMNHGGPIPAGGDPSLIRYAHAVGNHRWPGRPPLSQSVQVGRDPTSLWSDMVVTERGRQLGHDRLLRRCRTVCPMWSPTCGDSVHTSDRGSWHPTALVSAVGVTAPLDAVWCGAGRLRSYGSWVSGSSLSSALMVSGVAVFVCCPSQPARSPDDEPSPAAWPSRAILEIVPLTGRWLP